MQHPFDGIIVPENSVPDEAPSPKPNRRSLLRWILTGGAAVVGLRFLQSAQARTLAKPTLPKATTKKRGGTVPSTVPGKEGGTATSMVVGEEGGTITTMIVGEEGGTVTSMIVGEEGGTITPVKPPTRPKKPSRTVTPIKPTTK